MIAPKPHARGSVIGSFLIKLAKHLAVLSCLMIAGTATGRTNFSAFGIFLIVLAASLADLSGRALQRRLPAFARLSKSDHDCRAP